MTKNQVLIFIYALLNVMIIHSQFIFPSFIIQKEIALTFSWTLPAIAMIIKYFMLMSLTDFSAKKVAFLSVGMTFVSELFSLLPLLLLDGLVSWVYNTTGAYFIAWFVFSIIFKTLIEYSIIYSYDPTLDRQTLFFWIASVQTIVTLIGAIGYSMTYYLNVM